MKENLIKILKIYGIYAIITVPLSALLYLLFYVSGDEPTNLPKAIGFALLLPILFTVVFSPAIVCLWLLFKKIKSPNWRMFLIAFLIPLTNLIYFFLESQIINPIDTPTNSMSIGAVTLFCVLPLLFITACFVPKTIIPFKKQSILTVLFTFISGLIMIVALGCIEIGLTKFAPELKFRYFSMSTSRELSKYNPMIQYIEDYKKQNGKYPLNVDSTKIEQSKFSEYDYSTFNDEQDYILHVDSPEHKFGEGFYYCSSKKLPSCNIGYDEYGNTYKRIGKWIHMYYE